MVPDPILLTPVRFIVAQPVLRVDSGTAQDITIPVDVDTDYWLSEDSNVLKNRADLAQILADALNLNTDGVVFTVTLSDRNVFTVSADAAFQLLWTHANTTAPPAVFGFTGDTVSGTSATASEAAQGCWVPSLDDGHPRPPKRDKRPQPIIRGVVASTISGRSRGYDLSGDSTLGERSMIWAQLKREKVLTEYAQTAAPYGALEWWWNTGGAKARPIRYYSDKLDRTSYWLGRAKRLARPWKEDRSYKLVQYDVDLDLREASEPAQVSALDAMTHNHVVYSSETITGAGPHTWPPSAGVGPTLAVTPAQTLDVSTSPMLAAGIGTDRVNKAFTPGTSSFSATNLGSFPAGPVNLRCVFRPSSEAVGFLWAYAASGVELLQGRFSGASTLVVSWRNDPAAVYSFNVPVTDGDWHLLDLIVEPTGGSGGVSKITAYINGVDVSPAEHTEAITVARDGLIGLGSNYNGTGPMLGDFQYWSLRGPGLTLAQHIQHAQEMGVA